MMADNESNDQLTRFFKSNCSLRTPKQIKSATLDELRLDERLWTAYERGFNDFLKSFMGSQLMQTETPITQPEISAMVQSIITRYIGMENAGRDRLHVPPTSISTMAQSAIPWHMVEENASHHRLHVPPTSNSAMAQSTIPRYNVGENAGRNRRNMPPSSISAMVQSVVTRYNGAEYASRAFLDAPPTSVSARGPVTPPTFFSTRGPVTPPTFFSTRGPGTTPTFFSPRGPVTPTFFSARRPVKMPRLSIATRRPVTEPLWDRAGDGWKSADRTAAVAETRDSSSTRYSGQFQWLFNRSANVRDLSWPLLPFQRVAPMPRNFVLTDPSGRVEQDASAVRIMVTPPPPPDSVEYVPTAAESRFVNDDDV